MCSRNGTWSVFCRQVISQAKLNGCGKRRRFPATLTLLNWRTILHVCHCRQRHAEVPLLWWQAEVETQHNRLSFKLLGQYMVEYWTSTTLHRRTASDNDANVDQVEMKELVEEDDEGFMEAPCLTPCRHSWNSQNASKVSQHWWK